jgi:hypothetical protein
MSIFLVKNFYNYECVIPPPKNLPTEMITVYVTDSQDNSTKAKDLGWNYSPIIEDYINIDDKFSRRKVVALVNSYPSAFLPAELKHINKIFVCDSNIEQLWSGYPNFVDSCKENKALYVTSGFYSGDRDNILSEMYGHLDVREWSYGHADIKKYSEIYIQDLENLNIDWRVKSVVSAKYIGWNTTHPFYKILSDTLYKEYCKHLAGNIILTYMSYIYSDYVNNFYTKDYLGYKLGAHRFGG